MYMKSSVSGATCKRSKQKSQQVDLDPCKQANIPIHTSSIDKQTHTSKHQQRQYHATKHTPAPPDMQTHACTTQSHCHTNMSTIHTPSCRLGHLHARIRTHTCIHHCESKSTTAHLRTSRNWNRKSMHSARSGMALTSAACACPS